VKVSRIPTLSRTLVLERSWPVVLDMTVAAFCLATFYCVVLLGRYWFSHPVPSAEISQSARALPLYAFYSVARIGVAYLLSLIFAVGYGYYAAYHPRVEAFMIAVLDILQSIPVLSFLPGVMLVMVSLLPTRQLGVEMGAILLIFTGQVWNMAFSFYSSIRSIPRELREASQIYGFTAWQRFWQLELPFSAIGLVWNSMVSVAGGWFFLMACEMFVLGDRDFRLPGLGSYLQTAAGNGNTRAMIWGLAVMIAIIVATDQLIWRPVIAWADKFKFEQVESSQRATSPILYALRNSNAISWLHEQTILPLGERIYHGLATRRLRALARPERSAASRQRSLIANSTLFIVLLAAAIFAAFHAVLLLRQLHGAEILELLKGAGATFLRVNASLLIAALWTIPVGVAIGFNPRLARIAQPLAQIAASVPATALFPVLLIALVHAGGGLGIGSIALMLLGTQWYILFNVIAGAIAIPSDLKEVAGLFHFGSVQRWKTLILPGIFPYLITGMVTASGGAWNASIIAEYFHLKDQTMQTVGLGAQISSATDHGQFQLLLLSTIVMALMVVTINRLIWRPLYRLSETRYKLDA
jgi:NitT/TauT family transport system permease protein